MESLVTSELETRGKKMRYICRYAKIITTSDPDRIEIDCDVPQKELCPMPPSGEFKEKCLSRIPEAIFSKSIEEHEKRFHNLKKDC